MTFNFSAHGSSAGRMDGCNSTPWANWSARRFRAASPGSRTGGLPGATGEVRHASAKKDDSRKSREFGDAFAEYFNVEMHAASIYLR